MKEHLMILPTADIVDNFRRNVQSMTNHDYDYGEIVNDVFRVLAYAPDSIDAIKKHCDGIVTNFDRADAHDDGIILANAVGVFIGTLRELLLRVDAWDSSGILRVKYYRDIANDWVLQVIDSENEPIVFTPSFTNTDILPISCTNTIFITGTGKTLTEALASFVQPPEDGSS